MMLQQRPVNAVTPGLAVLLSKVGKILSALLATKAHADIVITVKDGNIQVFRVNQSFLPQQLPDV